jgi:hypothetical protein
MPDCLDLAAADDDGDDACLSLPEKKRAGELPCYIKWIFSLCNTILGEVINVYYQRDF